MDCPVCGETQCSEVLSGIRDWEYGVDGSFSHWRCTACGVVHLQPFPDVALLRAAYDVDYHGYVEPGRKGPLYRLLHYANERMLLHSLKRVVRPGARVLDVGCGSGGFLFKVLKLGPSVAKGLDFSPVAVEMAKRNGVVAHEGLFLDLAGSVERFDAIFMNNYLEHTVDPSGELEVAHELLSPGGYLVGEVPSYRSVDRYVFGRYWGGNHVPRHTFQFSPRSLERLLIDKGFSSVSIRQQANTGHWALSVQNYLQRTKTDLKDNPALRHGRAPYFQALLLAFLPINALLALAGLSSVIRFAARA